jgi:hypothetical protein
MRRHLKDTVTVAASLSGDRHYTEAGIALEQPSEMALLASSRDYIQVITALSGGERIRAIVAPATGAEFRAESDSDQHSQESQAVV